MGRELTSTPPVIPGYSFLQPLGKGGFAEVFLYEQDNTHLRVAVKVLFKESISDAVRRQFEAEAKAMAELGGHPNIVQVFQAGISADGRPYMVMQYYPQSSLDVRVRKASFSVPAVLQIGVRIACAVETAHRAGILHRDIKPANILTSQYGEPGLTDFGIATRDTQSDAESEGVSMPWSAPEIVYSTARATRSSDVYSLGATLWHLLVGRGPFSIPGLDSRLALMHRIRDQAVPATGREDVPSSLERLLANAMAKDPQRRPQTALALALSLQAVESEQRLAPTPLVLLEEAGSQDTDGPRTNTAVVDGADETRIRRPQTVNFSQPAAAPLSRSPRASSTSRELDDATVRRPRPVLQPDSAGEFPDPATIRRPAVVASAVGSADVPPADVPPGADQLTDSAARDQSLRDSSTRWYTGRRAFVAASIGTVIAAVAVLVVLSSPTGHSGSPTSTTTAVDPPSVVSPSLGVPIVSGTRISASQVRFTWSVSNYTSSDVFYWKVPGGSPTKTTATTVTVNAPSPSQACITIEVVNGSSYADSGQTCVG